MGRRGYRQICDTMSSFAKHSCETWLCFHHVVQIVNNATAMKLKERYTDPCRRNKQLPMWSSGRWSRHNYSGIHSTTMEGGAGAICQAQRWEGYMKCIAARGVSKQTVGESQDRTAAATSAMGRRSYRQFPHINMWEDDRNDTATWPIGKQRVVGSQNSSPTGTTATGRRSYRQISNKIISWLDLFCPGL